MNGTGGVKNVPQNCFARFQYEKGGLNSPSLQNGQERREEERTLTSKSKGNERKLEYKFQDNHFRYKYIETRL